MTKEQIPTEKCDICLNEVPEDMMRNCPGCGKRVCLQCSDDAPEGVVMAPDEAICIECSWNEQETGGQGMWKLTLWNLYFAGPNPNLVLSDADVVEARNFLVRNNFPKPADCPWKNCPAWRYTCDSADTCQIAMRMCHSGWDPDANDDAEEVEDENLLIRKDPGEVCTSTAGAMKVRTNIDPADLTRVVGDCPECHGKLVNRGFWDIQCTSCGLLFSVLPPDGAEVAETCAGCGATADCRAYGPASQGCGSRQVWTDTPKPRGEVFNSGLYAGIGP